MSISRCNKIYWLNANAGSGKTTWIMKQISQLLSNNVEPNQILCITFSNTAANEITERVFLDRKKTDNFAYTLHAFCFKLLQRHNSNYKIMTPSLEALLWNQSVEEAFLQKPYSNDGSKQSWSSDIMDKMHLLYCTENQENRLNISKLANGLLYHGELGEFQMLVQKIFSARKEIECMISFDDILDHTIRLIASSVGGLSIFEMMGQVEHLFIDEAQDLSQKQWEVVFALLHELTQHEHFNIYIVGDEKQSIYSFQGASLESYKEAKNTLKDLASFLSKNNQADSDSSKDVSFEEISFEEISFEEILLEETYRCPANVCKFVDKVFEDVFIHKHISKVKEGQLKHFCFENEDEMIDDVVNQIIQQVKQDKNILLLIRKRNPRYNKLAEKITQAGFTIEYDYLQNMKECLSAFVNLLIDKNSYNLYCFLNTSWMNADQNKIYLIYKSNPENFLSQMEKYFMLDGSTSIFEAVSNCQNMHHVIDILEYLILCGFDLKHDFIMQAGQFFTNYPFSFMSLLDFIKRYSIAWDMPEDKNKTKISIQTVHQSKGQEADVVFIFDMELNPNMSPIDLVHNGENILLNDHPEYEQFKAEKRLLNLAEHQRLFYVALTRTKKDLIMCSVIKEKMPESSWYKQIEGILFA